MPKVIGKGGKVRAFAYSPSGEKAAAGYAKATGGTLTKKPAKKRKKKAVAKKMPAFLGGM